MIKCKICKEKIRKGFENYRNEAIKIPFINIIVWRYNFAHLKCIKRSI